MDDISFAKPMADFINEMIKREKRIGILVGIVSGICLGLAIGLIVARFVWKWHP